MGRLAAVGLLAEREAFAARTALGNGLYSATPWPSTQQMCLHNELSYLPDPPAFMFFACLTPPAAGGATPVGDASAVLQALPPALVSRLDHEGWMLVRNYNDEIGASWAEAFGTNDRGAVEHYCRSQGIEFTWNGDGLSTKAAEVAGFISQNQTCTIADQLQAQMGQDGQGRVTAGDQLAYAIRAAWD